MVFSKSKFLTLFLLFCSLHLAFANEKVEDNPIAQSEIVGQQKPYAQDCCNYGHGDCCNNGYTGNCGGAPNGCGGCDYCNPPPCVQNGCGCEQNPSNRCGGCSACQPYPPSCSSCGRARTNMKVEAQPDSDQPSSESMPSPSEH